MAAKIFAFIALLALWASATTAVIIPQYYSPLSAATAATIPQYFPSLASVGSAHSFVQQQQAALAVSPAVAPYSLNQLTFANPAAYWQQQQLFPFNQLATANPALFLQQQQIQSFN